MDFNNKHEDWEKEAPNLIGIGKKNPFIVPEDYFATAELNIKFLAGTEHLKTRVENHGFQVPADYFTQLTEKINQKVLAEVETKQPKVRRLNFSWVKYAAAACVTVTLAYTLYIDKQDNSNNLSSRLHTIPDTEIVNYLQANSDGSDTPVIIENLGSNPTILDLKTDAPQEDLEQYLNSTTL